MECATSVPTPLITRSAVCTQHITSPLPRSTACLTRDCALYFALLSYTDDIYTDDHKSWQRQKYKGGSKERKMSTSFWQGLHFSRCQGLNPDKDRVWRLSGGAPSAIFNVFDFFALELENFRSPAGACLGSEGSWGVPRGKSRRDGLDFLSKGVKFPGKFPELCFLPRGQISKGISRNLYLGQRTT